MAESTELKWRTQWKSQRLEEYDYSQPGAYFITICTDKKKCLFGNIDGGRSILNSIGNIAETCWTKIPEHFPDIEISNYVVMPNHIHGIIFILDSGIKPLIEIHQPNESKTMKPQNSHKKDLLSVVVGSYKSAVTKRVNLLDSPENFKWQRYFHDHIVRSERALEKIYNYIEVNPQRWDEDLENGEYLKEITETNRKMRLKKQYRGMANVL